MIIDLCILTVVDTISATSMPVNEFVLYREKMGFPYRQIMIVCSDKGDDNVDVPNSIAVYYVGNNRRLFRERLKEIKGMFKTR